MARDSKEIYREWTALRASGERLLALDMADRFGLSECELLATACGVSGEIKAIRLEADWPTFLAELPKVGHVKAVTRNKNAVIEVEGEYGNVEFFGAMGQSVSSIDLRIFGSRWKHGFAVDEETKRGPSHSLQFFDAAGRAIHKIYLRPQSDAVFFADLVTRYTSADQSPRITVTPAEAPPPPKPDAAIDVAGMRDAWSKMTDSHQFFGLLRQFEVARTQALRLAGSEFTKPLALGVAEDLLNAAQKAQLPFMTFVGNVGIIQINTSVAKKVAAMGPWINILDPGFDFHLRTDAIEEAWLVRKPTSDGIVTSIEIYDASGEQIVLFVGKRKPGIPESEAWRALAESLPSLA